MTGLRMPTEVHIPALRAVAQRQMVFDDLLTAIGVATPPASWRTHWPAFVQWSDNATADWRINVEAVAPFDLPADAWRPLSAAMARIGTDAVLARLGAFWHFLVYHLPAEIGDNSNAWLLPADLLGVPVRLFALAVLASGVHRAVANAAASGMSSDVAAASLAFVGHRVREVRDRGRGPGVESMTFLRHVVRGELFRLGRLSFRVSAFPWPLRVQGDLSAARGFAGHRRLNVGDCHGHWSAKPRAASIAPGDLRVEVHVPGGAPLDPDACAASYRAAMSLLPPRHPGRPLVAFTCLSWLLDPALRTLPVPPRNILRFAEPYRPLPVTGDHRQAYDLIYGDPDADPRRAEARTSLQRGIAQHVANGGRIRAVAGVIPWDAAASRFGA